LRWKKAPQNPVLDGKPGAWDATGEHAPFVMKAGKFYKMWYEGSDGNVRQLGLALSRDGVHWWKYPHNPVLRAGPEPYDQFAAGHGTVLYEHGLYKLWYHAIGDLDGVGDPDAIIAYATSPDGIHWTKHGPVLVGATDSWDTGLWGPSVLKVKGTYWMWYSAGGPLYPISIGLATSPDGVNWTRVGDSPVITDPEAVNNFGDPSVIFDRGCRKEDNFLDGESNDLSSSTGTGSDGFRCSHGKRLFKMWMGNFTSERAIYYAESEDGIDWTDPVPVLLPGSGKKEK
jgi:predicted GH43/DUF377 family glycosyl hydrolase